MDSFPVQTELRPIEEQTSDIPVHFAETTIKPMNNMERSLVNNLKSMRKVTKHKECRICLEDNEEQSKLVLPCKCTGSMESAHQHCLIEWIKRRVQSEPKKKARCEVCDTEFNYKMTNQRTFDCSQLIKHYNKQPRSIVGFCVVYLFFFFMYFALIGMVVTAKQQDYFMTHLMQSGGGTTIIVSVLIIYFLALLVVGILFVSEYLVREEVLIKQVMDYVEPKSFIKNYKIYFKR